MGRSRDAHKWIGGAHARRERLAIGIGLETIAQEAGIALVDIVKASHRSSGVGEGFGRDAPRGSNGQWGVHVVQVRFCISDERAGMRSWGRPKRRLRSGPGTDDWGRQSEHV